MDKHNAVALETLNVKGMVKNHHLAQSIADAAWSSFVLKLEYKAEWYGKTILRIGRFEPSSEKCSVCGYKNRELKLGIENGSALNVTHCMIGTFLSPDPVFGGCI